MPSHSTSFATDDTSVTSCSVRCVPEGSVVVSVVVCVRLGGIKTKHEAAIATSRIVESIFCFCVTFLWP
jgi:hypothetical protein